MREKFQDFFEKRGHARISPYPIVARWREDIHLTIASIAVFQPHVTSGLVPPQQILLQSASHIRLPTLPQLEDLEGTFLHLR